MEQRFKSWTCRETKDLRLVEKLGYHYYFPKECVLRWDTAKINHIFNLLLSLDDVWDVLTMISDFFVEQPMQYFATFESCDG